MFDKDLLNQAYDSVKGAPDGVYKEAILRGLALQLREKNNEENLENARSQARAQYESIVEMVAALDVDYDRLEELRDERRSIESDYTLVVRDDGFFDAIENADPDNKFYRLGTHSETAWEALYACLYQEEAKELTALEEDAGDYKDEDDARQRIQEDALSVEVRSGWTRPGETMEAEEFRILLCTGGPAVQIVGELGSDGPARAWLEYQDWFTPWTEYHENVDQDVLLEYCREFFGG